MDTVARGGHWVIITSEGGQMILTIEGTYENGRVELAERPRGADHSRVLVTFLPERGGGRGTVRLLGIYAGAVPEDLDIDAALKEIRGEWLGELEEFHGA